MLSRSKLGTPDGRDRERKLRAPCSRAGLLESAPPVSLGVCGWNVSGMLRIEQVSWRWFSTQIPRGLMAPPPKERAIRGQPLR